MSENEFVPKISRKEIDESIIILDKLSNLSSRENQMYSADALRNGSRALKMIADIMESVFYSKVYLDGVELSTFEEEVLDILREE